MASSRVMSGGMAAPYWPLRTASWAAVKETGWSIRLPERDHGPLRVLLSRLGIAALLVLLVSVITYLDRDGFSDGSGEPLSALDALYFGAVSVTSTGYGDITPVTDGAKL